MITALFIAIGMYSSFLFGQHSMVDTKPLPAPKNLSVQLQKIETVEIGK